MSDISNLARRLQQTDIPYLNCVHILKMVLTNQFSNITQKHKTIISLVQAFDEMEKIQHIDENKINMDIFVIYINSLFDKGRLLINIFDKEANEKGMTKVFNKLIFYSYFQLSQYSQNYYIKQLYKLDHQLFLELIGNDIQKLNLKQVLIFLNKLDVIVRNKVPIEQQIMFNISQALIKALNIMFFQKFQSAQCVLLDVAYKLYQRLPLELQQQSAKIYICPSYLLNALLNESKIFNYVQQHKIQKIKNNQLNIPHFSQSNNNAITVKQSDFAQSQQQILSLAQQTAEHIQTLTSSPNTLNAQVNNQLIQPFISQEMQKCVFNLLYSSLNNPDSFQHNLFEEANTFFTLHGNQNNKWRQFLIYYSRLFSISIQQQILSFNCSGINFQLKFHGLQRENLPSSLFKEYLHIYKRFYTKLEEQANRIRIVKEFTSMNYHNFIRRNQMINVEEEAIPFSERGIDNTIQTQTTRIQESEGQNINSQQNINEVKSSQFNSLQCLPNPDVSQITSIDFLQLLFIQKRISVSYANESGIDDGGLSQELFPAVIEQLVTKSSYQLFEQLGNFYYINPIPFSYLGQETALNFQFFGACLGCCLIRNVSVPNYFPSIFNDILFVCEIQNFSAEQLETYYKEIDEEFVEQLNKSYENKIINDLEMTFSYSINVFGQNEVMKLGDNAEKPVTQENFKEYKALFFKNRLLSEEINEKFQHIRKGFYMVIHRARANIVGKTTLMYLLYGDSWEDILNYLERVVQCQPPYTKKSQQIVWLFQVLREMSHQEFRNFLRFMYSQENIVTQTNQFKFKISPNRHLSGFPVAHTCAQHLDLPQYESKEKLKQKLLFSIQHYNGFGIQ